MSSYVVDAINNQHAGDWGDQEGLIRDIYVDFLRPGDFAIDVGVNRGSHFWQMIRAVGTTGHVVGFEAVPDFAAFAMKTVEQEIPDLMGSATLHNVAVSDHSGEATFYISRMNDGGLSSLADRPILIGTEVEIITAPVRTIDECITSDAPVRFMKIDIEGGEFHALKGAPRVLSHRPLITFEWDKSAPVHFNYDTSELVGFLTAQGYCIFDLFGSPYPDAASLMAAPIWNFVAVPEHLSAAEVLKPSLTTLGLRLPALNEVILRQMEALAG